jgi:hypothetical protein
MGIAGMVKEENEPQLGARFRVYRCKKLVAFYLPEPAKSQEEPCLKLL